MTKDILKIIKKDKSFEKLFDKRSVKNHIMICFSLTVISTAFLLSHLNVINLINGYDIFLTVMACFFINVLFIYACNNLNILKSIDLYLFEDIYSMNKKERFNLLSKNINLGILVENYKELYKYFKKNDYEEEFKKLTKNYLLSENIIPEYYFKSLIQLTAKEWNINEIDLFYSLKEDLDKNVCIPLINLFQYEAIYCGLEKFTTLKNIQSENGKKLYDYFKDISSTGEHKFNKDKLKEINLYIREYEKINNKKEELSSNLLTININSIQSF